MSAPNPERRTNLILAGVFLAALVAHAWWVTRNWTAGFMPGHEFRQTQTAITSYYIDQQDNFSLLYETPIVGKPWVSILMEVPIYEWAVVGLSRLAHVPHVVAARTISLACFYLMLPALYLLLGRLGLAAPRRLLVLALTLVCPLYIFYSRAFLMDSMELMCCAWFLFGFVRMMDRRRWQWFVLTMVAGTGAALVKSATLAVWLWPPALYTGWLLGRDLRSRAGWAAPAETAFWAVAGVIVPLGALRWWIALTDPLKVAHASAWIFTSENLSLGNWGLTDLHARFSPPVWRILAGRWGEGIMPSWLLLTLVGAGLLFLPKVRWPALAMAGMFFWAQLLFPYAYAYQDYYFYSCAVFLAAALGFFLSGLLDSRLPRWLVWPLLAVPFAAQIATYRGNYYPQQLVKSDGGFAFTTALRDFLPKDSVIIVVGADWSAIVPYYAQRKALMVRNGLEFNQAYLRRAFADLADEEVSALVLFRELRTNQEFINLAASRFDLDARSPTFTSATVDVYVARPYARAVRAGLQDKVRFTEITVPAPPEDTGAKGAEPVTPEIARGALAGITPAPYQMRFFLGGAGRQGRGGDSVIIAQPDSDVWLVPPANATQIHWGFGVFPGAYEKAEGRTDGVEFSIWVEQPDGQERRIYRRLLDPWAEPADRGDQHAVVAYTPRPGERLRFTSGPGGGSAFDWAYWTGIEVK